MGQLLQRYLVEEDGGNGQVEPGAVIPVKFPDLSALPPELSLLVLSNLNATDLCLAACVWDKLGNDEILWQSLCKSSWGSVSIYQRCRNDPSFSYRKLFLCLDEATLTFNGDPFKGEEYLISKGLVDDSPIELAKFIHTSRKIKAQPRRMYLDRRRDVLDHVMQLQNYENQFLPNAMRKLFSTISAPAERGSYLEQIIDKFAERFCNCNPNLGLHKGKLFSYLEGPLF
ncbi:F-box only protein 8-like [Ruditapes philippinarum]|uniref:F-box only protein 8-like n=1 Tax=Ruditapes philippinarum TaxID=129788 RepID=UPI00295BEED3|nr:F-box only protein 8-like [Ruditapes philippinarum]